MTTWVILLLLFVKHFLADFVWQTDKMVMEKGKYGKWGGIHHSGVHAAMTAAVIGMFFPLHYALMLGLVDFVIHYHTDWAKMNISKQYTPKDKQFWVWLGVDQLIHSLTYITIVATTSLLTSGV